MSPSIAGSASERPGLRRGFVSGSLAPQGDGADSALRAATLPGILSWRCCGSASPGTVALMDETRKPIHPLPIPRVNSPIPVNPFRQRSTTWPKSHMWNGPLGKVFLCDISPMRTVQSYVRPVFWPFSHGHDEIRGANRLISFSRFNALAILRSDLLRDVVPLGSSQLAPCLPLRPTGQKARIPKPGRSSSLL